MKLNRTDDGWLGRMGDSTLKVTGWKARHAQGPNTGACLVHLGSTLAGGIIFDNYTPGSENGRSVLVRNKHSVAIYTADSLEAYAAILRDHEAREAEETGK